VYLEDLFVTQAARGKGVGRRLITRLAAIAVERGWERIDFQVLDWNPARGFYRRNRNARSCNCERWPFPATSSFSNRSAFSAVEVVAITRAPRQAHPGEDRVDVGQPLPVGLRVLNVDAAGDTVDMTAHDLAIAHQLDLGRVADADRLQTKANSRARQVRT
jgi:hypothetical protein